MTHEEYQEAYSAVCATAMKYTPKGGGLDAGIMASLIILRGGVVTAMSCLSADLRDEALGRFMVSLVRMVTATAPTADAVRAEHAAEHGDGGAA